MKSILIGPLQTGGGGNKNWLDYVKSVVTKYPFYYFWATQLSSTCWLVLTSASAGSSEFSSSVSSSSSARLTDPRFLRNINCVTHEQIRGQYMNKVFNEITTWWKVQSSSFSFGTLKQFSSDMSCSALRWYVPSAAALDVCVETAPPVALLALSLRYMSVTRAHMSSVTRCWSWKCSRFSEQTNVTSSSRRQ